MAQIQAAQRDKDPTGRESQTVVRFDNSPLPPAQELEAIQRINPELVSFVIKELSTQYEFERQTIRDRDATVRYLNKTGLWLGAGLAALTIICSTVLVYTGNAVTGGVLGVLGIASVVAVIVNAGSNQRKADQLANLRERATPPQKGKK